MLSLAHVEVRTHNSKGIESYDMKRHGAHGAHDGRVLWWEMGGAHARVRTLHGTTASMLDPLAKTITLALMRHASNHGRPCGGRGAM